MIRYPTCAQLVFGIFSRPQIIVKELARIPSKNKTDHAARGEGEDKKVLSFSLFGQRPKYLYGAIKILQQQPTVFPGWTCRFYVAENMISSVTDELSAGGAEVIIMRPEKLLAGTFWRFLAADEDNLDACLMLDVDSPLLERQKCATDEWLNSDKFYHVLRDHRAHSSKIMGGMWGVKKLNPVVLNMRQEIENFISLHKEKYYRREGDQMFLAKVVYPRIRKHTLFHVDPGFKVFPGEEDVRRIPGPRRHNLNFIGIILKEQPRYFLAICYICLKRFQFIHAFRFLFRGLRLYARTYARKLS